MSSAKRPAEGDANSAKGKKLAPEDNALKDLQEVCPVAWTNTMEDPDFFGTQEEVASLTLGTEVDGGDHPSMLKKAAKLLDPEQGASVLHIDAKELELDTDAAKAALKNTGEIDNVFDFTNKDRGYKYWMIECKKKEKLSYEKAKKSLEDLLKGNFCQYRSQYDFPEKTPFGEDGEEPKYRRISEKEAAEKKESLARIKQAISTLLQQKSCVVEHAWWLGHCEHRGEYDDTRIEREDYFFFETSAGSSNFVLKFEWQHIVGWKQLGFAGPV
ncbi:MAG: hypothetical protein SGILL_010582 [Bacillariaceae sp.]